MTKMTVGSNALASFKSMCPNFSQLFPVLPLDVDADIRRSYKGGFTYLSPKYKEKTTGKGIVLDINSAYPAQMVKADLPYGMPEPFEGKYKYDPYYPLYTQRLSCTFEIKPDKIPSIQIKSSMSFMPNEYIESSKNEIVTLTLTNPDLELFFEQYNVTVIEWQGGWKFKKAKGIFTKYINYWMEQKIKSKKEGNRPQTMLAKLHLNSLYGKLATNPIGRQKAPVIRDGELHYEMLPTEERKPIYIPAATFITAYQRKYIIECSQAIRDWSEKNKGFDAYCYSDTDSCHILLEKDDLKPLSHYIPIDPYELGAWDCEAEFTRARFLRQKCYIEEIEGEIHATVAGMPKKLSHLITFDNFNIGFTTEDFTDEQIGPKGRKLKYVHTDGGVVLMPTEFSIK